MEGALNAVVALAIIILQIIVQNVEQKWWIVKMGHKRKVQDKHRLEKLYNATKTKYGSGAWYDERKGRYIKYSPSDNSKYAKYLRKAANKKVRKTLIALQGGEFKKIFDYLWLLF